MENSDELTDNDLKFKKNSNIKIEHLHTLGDGKKRISNISFSPDDKYLATACWGGQLNIYSINKGNNYFNISTKKEFKKGFEYTCIKWRKNFSNNVLKNVIYTTNNEGEFQGWHLNSKKNLFTITDDDEENIDSQLFNFDLSSDEKLAAYVGAYPSIRIVDLEKRKKIINLKGEGSRINGHSNRIFSVNFYANDNLLVTGGWDQRIIFWDLRDRIPVDSIYGHLICGDGLDIFNDNLLITSYFEKDQIKLYNLRERKYIEYNNKVESFIWTNDLRLNFENSSNPCKLYTTKFSKKGNFFLTGGSGANEAKLYDINGKNYAIFGGLTKEILTVDFSYDDTKFAIAGKNGYAWIYSTNLDELDV